MKTSDVQQKNAQQPATQQRKGTATLESPQSEQIAQLEAMAESSPQADKLAQSAGIANNSPQAAAQRQMIDTVNNSSLMAAQRQQLDGLAREPVQREEAEETPQPEVAQREEAPAKPNNTGLPDNLKSGIESLSGISMDNVKVHYNSSQPAQLNAHAYAQGTDIHVAPGQEQHLPHEAWHVVQQAQGRVQPTMQMKGDVPINDDKSLEREADVMGDEALQIAQRQKARPNPIGCMMGAMAMNNGTNSTADSLASSQPLSKPIQTKNVIQRLAGFEVELRIPFYQNMPSIATDNTVFTSVAAQALAPWRRRSIINFLFGGLGYGNTYGQVPGHFDISADHTGWRNTHAALKRHIVNNHLTLAGLGPSMSNMEYRTTALEERDNNAQATMQSIADEIKAHARTSTQSATIGLMANLPAPVSDKFTGIPVSDLRTLLHNDLAGMALFNTMNNALDPSLYFQSTVGALPSEIPGLFTEAAQDIDPANAGNNVKAELLRAAVTRAAAAFNHGNNAAFVATFTPGERQSLLGWMTLLAQFLLAYQVETTSARYSSDGAGHLYPRGTSKNIVPYLSKTDLVSSINALPPNVRPSPLAGANTADWIRLFRYLERSCRPNVINLVNTLGLNDYTGQNYHRKSDNTVRGVVGHGEVFLGGETPSQWLSNLLQRLPAGNNHVGSGNPLSLDGGQGALNPELTIRGEQAIPLEDRASQSKASFGDPHDIDHLDDTLMHAWSSAKNRRMHSTSQRTTYQQNYALTRTTLDAYGTLNTLIPALNALEVRYAALHNNPADVITAQGTLTTLQIDVMNWVGANHSNNLALGLLTTLIQKPNWSTKGFRLIGSNVVPDGVVELRTELNAGNNTATTLTNLQAIGTRKLRSGSRKQVTTNMYELVRDAPGWITSGVGWTQFVNKYNLTDRAV